MLRRDKFFATMKFVFMAPKVLFLGYMVSGNDLQVDESKIEAIGN